jgi:hypothetical protein
VLAHFRPEKLNQSLAWMQAAFNGQVGQERQRLDPGYEVERSITLCFWHTEQM